MDLCAALSEAKQKGLVPVIAEIKRVIPRLAAAGRPPDTRPAAWLARRYLEGGAAAISLVTETRHFGGRPETDVPAVLRATSLPLLIKDFILDRAAVDAYASLVAAVCPDDAARVTLLLIAHRVKEPLPLLVRHIRSRGLGVLVETRGPADLASLEGVEPPPGLVGINNKNIDELEMGEDAVRLTPQMIAPYRQVLPGARIVSESAHHTVADVRRALAAGADAVLVGTAFLLAADPAAAVASFVQARQTAQGRPDVLAAAGERHGVAARA